MMCLLKIEGGEVRGWIVAADNHEMRRAVESRMGFEPNAHDIARQLYVREFWPMGKYDMGGGFVLLVDA